MGGSMWWSIHERSLSLGLVWLGPLTAANNELLKVTPIALTPFPPCAILTWSPTSHTYPLTRLAIPLFPNRSNGDVWDY